MNMYKSYVALTVFSFIGIFVCGGLTIKLGLHQGWLNPFTIFDAILTVYTIFNTVRIFRKTLALKSENKAAMMMASISREEE